MEVHQRFRRRKIRLLESGESIGNDMFFSCNSLHALESLAKFGKEPFIVTECYGFKTFTEEEISDEKAYEYEFGDEKIVVTGKEVRAFYSEVYRLTAQDIEQFAAYNTAKRKYYRKMIVSLPRSLSDGCLMKNI